jgi:hypothetical protein
VIVTTPRSDLTYPSLARIGGSISAYFQVSLDSLPGRASGCIWCGKEVVELRYLGS